MCPSDPKDSGISSKTVSNSHVKDHFLVRLLRCKIGILERIVYGRVAFHAKYSNTKVESSFISR